MISMVGNYRGANLIYRNRKQISGDLESEVRVINCKRHKRILGVIKIYYILIVVVLSRVCAFN